MIELADASRKPVDSLIWIDHEQAIIATREGDGSPLVEWLGRGALEPEAAFEARAVDELVDSDHVTVTGPAEPMRCARLMAWSSTAGFHQRSNKKT